MSAAGPERSERRLAAAMLLGGALLSAELGGLPPPLVRLATLLLTAVVAGSVIRSTQGALWKRLTPLVGWGALVLCPIGPWTIPLFLVWSVASGWASSLDGRLPAWVPGVLALGGLFVILDASPGLAYALTEATAWFSGRLVASIGGGALGASASGVTWGIACALFVWATRSGRTTRRTFVDSAALCLLLLAHLTAQSLAVHLAARDALKAIYIVLSIALLVRSFRPIQSERRPVPIPVLGVLGTVFLAGLVLLVSGASWWTSPQENLQITFVEVDMLASWKTPADAALGGAFTGASFGLLPRYLEAAGHTTRTVDAISNATLAGADLVVIINPGREIEPREREILLSFVTSGGGLAIMGDHTDVGGVARGVNALLASTGLKLSFDSAVAAQHDWRWALDVSPPLSMIHDPDEVHVSIGASVTTAPSILMTPLLVGTAAFSDPGDRSREENAFLGNLMFDRGERFGEIPLAVSRAYGDGRIALFGDTSEFQNSALPFSCGYVLSAFSWIADGPPAWCDSLRWLIGVVWILLLPIALRYAGSSGAWAVAAVLLIGTVAGSLNASSRLTAPRPHDGRLAIVDVAHHPRVSTNPLDDASLDGLLVSLGRAGYLPIVIDERPLPPVQPNDLYVSVGATSPLGDGEEATLWSGLESGARTIIATQWPTGDTAWPWFQDIGLTLRNVPLGLTRPTVDRLDVMPQFGATWALDPSDAWREIAIVSLGEESFVVACERSIGDGTITVVGDIEIFLTAALENRGEYVPENLEFMRRLLDEATP